MKNSQGLTKIWRRITHLTWFTWRLIIIAALALLLLSVGTVYRFYDRSIMTMCATGFGVSVFLLFGWGISEARDDAGHGRLGCTGALLASFFSGALLWGAMWGAAGVVEWITIRLSDLNAHVPEYLTVERRAPERGIALTVQEKMVVCGIDDSCVDSLHFDLPHELRASCDAEVRTIVLLKRSEEVKEWADGKRREIIHHCHVTVIDRQSRYVIGDRAFTGGEYYGVVYEDDHTLEGPKTDDDVLEYLLRLAEQGRAK